MIIFPEEIDSYIAYVSALSQKCMADLISEEIVPTILLISFNESLLNNYTNLVSLAFKIFSTSSLEYDWNNKLTEICILEVILLFNF